jgi:hypothetical protein
MPAGAQLKLPIEQVDASSDHLIINTILVGQKFDNCMLWMLEKVKSTYKHIFWSYLLHESIILHL